MLRLTRNCFTERWYNLFVLKLTLIISEPWILKPLRQSIKSGTKHNRIRIRMDPESAPVGWFFFYFVIFFLPLNFLTVHILKNVSRKARNPIFSDIS